MYNILICDDEPDIVSALKIYLASDGYGIYEAYNGREAIEMMQKTEIHLVLMDIDAGNGRHPDHGEDS